MSETVLSKLESKIYTQIGVQLSLYSGKTRAYLLHKRIPFVERASNPWEFFVTLPRRTHAAAVPVVITPEGEWLQDSSHIIDTLERRFPERPVLPATPVLRFAAYLFELWGDEFWLPLAMHTRWSHADESTPLFVHDAGDARWTAAPAPVHLRLGFAQPGRDRARSERDAAGGRGRCAGGGNALTVPSCSHSVVAAALRPLRRRSPALRR